MKKKIMSVPREPNRSTANCENKCQILKATWNILNKFISTFMKHITYISLIYFNENKIKMRNLS